MSHVVAIGLRNWGPYRGEQLLHLSPGPIAVVGHYDHDSDRSNWSGKTWLLGAVRWCLFGARPPDATREADVASHGEDECGVLVTLSDGVVVERTRTKAGPKLQVQCLPGAVGTAEGERAQQALIAHLGLTLDDFDSGLWVGQKAASRLVLSTPGQRAELVEGWLGLEKLRLAEKACSGRAAHAATQRQVALQAADGCMAGLVQLGPASELQAAQVRLAAVHEEHAAIDAQANQAHRRGQLQVQAEEFERVVAEGTELRDATLPEGSFAELVSEVQRLTEAEATARTVARESAAEAKRLAQLVVGEGFDGQCPVMCRACPVQATVLEVGATLSKPAAKARKVAAERADEHGEVLADLNTQRGMHAEQNRQRERLLWLRERALELEPAVDELEAMGEPFAEDYSAYRETLRAEERQLTAQIAAENEARKRHAAEQAAAQQHRDRAVLHDDEARRWLAAADVLRATRRELAELASAGIERGANQLLADTGVELQVEFRWAREGQGLANSCEKCGEGYPSKQSVKRCARCNAERQPKVVERLDFVPSRRSGAADDLAGLAVQLSAVAYLRAARGSELGTVFVDEPLAHLDTAHARMFAIKLQSSLQQLGFEQALVVAHAPALMASYPSRVVVRSDGKWARAEVQL